MEVLGNVVGLVDVLASRGSDLRERLTLFRHHPQQFEALRDVHNRIARALKQLENSPREELNADVCHDVRLIKKSLRAAHSELNELSQYFEFSSTPKRMKIKLLSRRRRLFYQCGKWAMKGKEFQRTKRTDEALCSVKEHLDLAWRVLSDIRMHRIEIVIAENITTDERLATPVVPRHKNMVLEDKLGGEQASISIRIMELGRFFGVSDVLPSRVWTFSIIISLLLNGAYWYHFKCSLPAETA